MLQNVTHYLQARQPESACVQPTSCACRDAHPSSTRSSFLPTSGWPSVYEAMQRDHMPSQDHAGRRVSGREDPPLLRIDFWENRVKYWTQEVGFHQLYRRASAGSGAQEACSGGRAQQNSFQNQPDSLACACTCCALSWHTSSTLPGRAFASWPTSFEQRSARQHRESG